MCTYTLQSHLHLHLHLQSHLHLHLHLQSHLHLHLHLHLCNNRREKTKTLMRPIHKYNTQVKSSEKSKWKYMLNGWSLAILAYAFVAFMEKSDVPLGKKRLSVGCKMSGQREIFRSGSIELQVW